MKKPIEYHVYKEYNTPEGIKLKTTYHKFVSGYDQERVIIDRAIKSNPELTLTSVKILSYCSSTGRRIRDTIEYLQYHC